MGTCDVALWIDTTEAGIGAEMVESIEESGIEESGPVLESVTHAKRLATSANMPEINIVRPAIRVVEPDDWERGFGDGGHRVEDRGHGVGDRCQNAGDRCQVSEHCDRPMGGFPLEGAAFADSEVEERSCDVGSTNRAIRSLAT